LAAHSESGGVWKGESVGGRDPLSASALTNATGRDHEVDGAEMHSRRRAVGKGGGVTPYCRAPPGPAR
jgi:hypothetical protein